MNVFLVCLSDFFFARVGGKVYRQNMSVEIFVPLHCNTRKSSAPLAESMLPETLRKSAAEGPRKRYVDSTAAEF